MVTELVVAGLLDCAFVMKFSRIILVWRIAFFPLIASIAALSQLLLPSPVADWVLHTVVCAFLFLPVIAAGWWFNVSAEIHEDLSALMAIIVWGGCLVALIESVLGDFVSALKSLAVVGFTVFLGFLWKWWRRYLAERRES